MARWLVTGGCGFIGSHLVERLLGAGDEVVVLDDLSTGTRDNVPAGLRVDVGCVTDAAAVARAMAGVDGCFHLAAVSSVERSVRDWVGTSRINLSGTITVFDAARRCHDGGPVPVVFASSAAVYGDNPAMPLSESSATGPLSAYGADKLACELHARVATGLHGVPAMGLRFFNIYGPRQNPASPYSGVISIFADRLSRRQPIAIHGDGGQVRDFVYVADAARCLTTAMARAQGGVVNVCTGRPTTIRQLADTIARLAEVALDAQPAPARAGDIRVSLGDPAGLRQALGESCGTALEDGLRATLAWLRGDAAQGR